MDLERLHQLDNLRTASLDARPVYIHEEHRWAVALIYHAQQERLLPIPCKLVCLDRHHDALPPTRERLRAIRDSRRAGLTAESVLSLCGDALSPDDDDWIPSAMEMGLLSDAVVLGGEGIFNRQALTDFEDHTGVHHHIALTGHLGPELSSFGRLADLRDRQRHELLWDILAWGLSPDGRLGFRPGSPPVALSIDLDYFVVPWETFRLPWPEEVYEKFFLIPSDQPAADGLTPRDFLLHLVRRAGLVALARETGHCGGEQKAVTIFRDVNRFLFDNRLQLPPNS